MSLPLTEKLILRQINHWNRMREYLHEDSSAVESAPRQVITVSRVAGSGGRSLAQELSQRLQLDLHDQSLVDRIASDRNLDRAVVAQLDEKPARQSELWVKGVFNRRIFMKDEYRTALEHTITSLAAAGGAVFLGRGANLILKERADVRVRVIAPWNVRLHRIMKRTGFSRPEARALMEETDRARDDFVRTVFAVEPGDPANFDLTLNSDRMTCDTMAETVLLHLLGSATADKVSDCNVS